MTLPFPEPDPEDMTGTEARFLTARVVPYTEATEGDRIFAMMGSIESARYNARGALVFTFEVPFDIVGDPTEIMRSQGTMVLIEGRKL